MQSPTDEFKLFTLFANLPKELQGLIWEHTVDWEFHVLPRPPITELAVCRHAREVLLRIYRPCFQPPLYKMTEDIHFSSGSRPGGRWLEIRGMGKRFPRSPYANYTTDVFHLPFHMMYKIQFGEPFQKILCQEAIEYIQRVVIWDRSWAPMLHGYRHRGLAGKPDRKLVLMQFSAVKTLYFANEPSVKVNIPPPLEEESSSERNASSFPLAPGDEVLAREKLALRSSYAEGKILIPDDNVKFNDLRFKMDLPRQWIDRQSTAFPDWSPPDLQMAKIIPDPRG
ncbi:hypothetical protein LAWI1_G001798 [Lachnellula willkommii]|uniref:Uncharacterized protein n=1 Tax=Lachnellula willkommii TaxID=215461 RepID=A0A559MHP2_9HELO|nr:hypothetical protein LAWI1_G001798 [Lachnellula willkommii]